VSAFACRHPHEALDMHPPALRFEPSLRQMASRLPDMEYSDRFKVRYVSANEGIR
jgi:hypothetical protein